MAARKTLIAGLFLLAGGASALAQGGYPDGYIQADPGYPPPAYAASYPEGPSSSSQSGLPNYVGLRGSLALSGGATTYTSAATPASLRSSFNTGGGGSIYIGTRLPLNLRAELEGLYRYQDARNIRTNGAASGARGTNQTAGGMLNLLWDIPLPPGGDIGIQPFVGMGVGGVYNRLDVRDAGNTTALMQRADWNLAYSFMAGLSVPLSDSSRINAMYRWMQVRDAGLNCAAPGTASARCVNTNLNSSTVDVGFEMDL